MECEHCWHEKTDILPIAIIYSRKCCHCGATTKSYFEHKEKEKDNSEYKKLNSNKHGPYLV